MPRRKYKIRLIKSDQQYHDLMVAKLINVVMKDGKKKTAEKIVYDSLNQIKEKKQEPIETLNKAIDNAGPHMIVRPRRMGLG